MLRIGKHAKQEHARIFNNGLCHPLHFVTGARLRRPDNNMVIWVAGIIRAAFAWSPLNGETTRAYDRSGDPCHRKTRKKSLQFGQTCLIGDEA